ncbi:unnamed protein product [Mycena citricolor]|uniref:HRDC domain-containing protein n=1 Tax=Mycena citricolor TaxID=2018698 RepID=A0AAD2HY78_9AGAR|nr:unnamed protein product [Mycena citricolor]
MAERAPEDARPDNTAAASSSSSLSKSAISSPVKEGSPMTPASLSASFAEFNTSVQAAALQATRSAAGLPSDIGFHRSIDRELADDLDAFSARVLSLTNNLLALAATAESSYHGKGKAKLQTCDDVVDDFHSLVVDSMDRLLERTDTCLDDFLGRNKVPVVTIDAEAVRKTQKPVAVKGGRLDPAVQHAASLVKPQLSFKHLVKNTDEPWYPALSHKFNAQVPLGHIFEDAESDTIMKHPYRYEITHTPYPQRMFQDATPIAPTPFESTSAIWVSTPEALASMVNDLRRASEIAIDLEHNDYRTYVGMVCLMQISTRTQDWIVDTLALRAELATGELNEVFTDPKIVKVLHGAESDVVWLQRDFNLYLVNLFDTFHASKLLEFPRHGLANLLEMYCDFTPDKRYQLADWRIRPLPDDMLQYARSDTHFLLFIYDNLRNALLDRARSRPSSPSPNASSNSSEHSFVRQVLTRSEETALRIYEKETYDSERGSGPGGWDSLARKWNKGALVAAAETPTGKETLQRAVYRCVHAWRDRIAREDDESVRYVLPNHFLFQLAEQPPSDMGSLLKLFQSVPPVVRRRAKELLDEIRACVDQYRSTPAALVEPKKDVFMEQAPLAQEVRAPVQSSLFGAAVVKASNVTASSSLFGDKAGPRTVALTSQFREVLSRIHNKLVVIPAMPVVQPDPEPVADPALGMQVEMPYVPPAQRAIRPVVDESIVVVGQARQKKRKRTKTETGGQPDTVEKTEPQEEFDFSAVPNILDDVPNDQDMRVKKKKKGDKRGKDKPMYGDFPAPPKAHRDVKSGNMSHTFKR